MESKYIHYQGKEIVYTDYRMKSPEEMVLTLNEAITFISLLENKGIKYLHLIDLRGVPVTTEFAGTLIDQAKHHVGKSKSAILGITGIKRMFFKSYLFLSKSEMRSFQDKEQALQYLVSK